MTKKSVVLIRTNTRDDVINTTSLVDEVQIRFPECDLVSLAEAGDPGLNLLKVDDRYSRVLVDEGGFESLPAKRARLEALFADISIEAVVMFHRASRRVEYVHIIRQLQALPGPKYVIFRDKRLVRFPNLTVLYSAIRTYCSVFLKPNVFDSLKNLINRRWREAAARTKMPTDARKIVWFTADGLGDTVASLPGLHRLSHMYPNAQIDFVVREAYSDLIRNIPLPVNAVLFEEPGHAARTKRNALKIQVLMFALALRRQRYDIAVDVSGRDIYRLLAYASGAPVRLGQINDHWELGARSNYHFLLNLFPQECTEHLHAQEQCLQLLADAGVPEPENQFRLRDCETGPSRREAQRLLRDHGIDGPFAIVHTKSMDPSKTMVPSVFGELVEHLITEHGLNVVMTGSKRDSGEIDGILEHVVTKEKAHNFAGLCALPVFISLLKQTKIVLTLDTGPMHLAAALGTPLVALFSPRLLTMYYPYGQREWMIYPTDEEILAAIKDKSKRRPRPIQCIATETIKSTIDRRIALIDSGAVEHNELRVPTLRQPKCDQPAPAHYVSAFAHAPQSSQLGEEAA